MNNKTISIVMPMYNAECLLNETIDSIISQSYKNWELIVVDNASTDSSRDIIKEYMLTEKRIRLIKSKSNSGGPAKPRNIGIQNALGDYISFIDSDDVWNINKLEKCKDYFEYDIIYHQEKCFESNINDGKLCKTTDILNINNLYKFLLTKGNIFSPSAITIKTSILKNFNFDEEDLFHGVEDFDLWIRLAKEKNFKYFFIKDVLGYYRIHANAFSKNFKKHGQKERNLIKNHFSEYSLFSSPYMFFIKYKKIFRSLIVNIIRTIQYKQKLDIRFYFKEFIKCF